VLVQHKTTRGFDIIPTFLLTVVHLKSSRTAPKSPIKKEERAKSVSGSARFLCPG
jgi:hypothetical protein